MTRERGSEERAPGEWEGARLALRRRKRKIVRKINKVLRTHVQRRLGASNKRVVVVFALMAASGPRGAGRGAPMGGNTQQRQSAKGEASVCEIDPRVSLPCTSQMAELRNGRWGDSYGTASFHFQLCDDGSRPL